MGSVILTKIKNRPGGFTDGLMTAVFGRFSGGFQKNAGSFGARCHAPNYSPFLIFGLTLVYIQSGRHVLQIGQVFNPFWSSLLWELGYHKVSLSSVTMSNIARAEVQPIKSTNSEQVPIPRKKPPTAPLAKLLSHSPDPSKVP